MMAGDRYEFRIGIELGGEELHAGIVNGKYQVIHRKSCPVLWNEDYRNVVENMAELVTMMLEQAGVALHQCGGMGIGCAGICNEERGEVVHSSHMMWNQVPLVKELKRYIPLSCTLTNRFHCMALGETLAGVAARCSHVVMMVLEEEVGSGIIIDKRIYSGKHGTGGELGHCTIVYNGRQCDCGRKGCLKAYASVPALLELAHEVAQKRKNTLLHQKERGEWTVSYLFDCALRHDKAAEWVVNRYLDYVSEGIVNAVNVFRPEMVVLGGEITQVPDVFVEELNRRCCSRYLGTGVLPVPKVVKACLKGDAAMIGAAFAKVPFVKVP